MLLGHGQYELRYKLPLENVNKFPGNGYENNSELPIEKGNWNIREEREMRNFCKDLMKTTKSLHAMATTPYLLQQLWPSVWQSHSPTAWNVDAKQKNLPVAGGWN